MTAILRARDASWMALLLAVVACSSSTANNTVADAAVADATRTDAALADAAKPGEGEAGSLFCSSIDDCARAAGRDSACCIRQQCVSGTSGDPAFFALLDCNDGGGQRIEASNYDQSCQADSDCVAIRSGEMCFPTNATVCPSAAINKKALSRYQADLAATNAERCSLDTSCVFEPGPCCAAGTCQLGTTACLADAGAPRDGGADAASE